MHDKLRQAWVGVILLASFVAPFLYVMATGHVWQVGRRIPGNVMDMAIALPSGLPVMCMTCAAWIAGFALLRRLSCSMLVSLVAANVLAAAVCLLAFLLSYREDTVLYENLRLLALYPQEGELNLFPLRFALAAALAFACSLTACKFAAKRR